MNTVQPIRDLTKIKKIESILKKQNYRNYILFRLGIYSGLRISDILKLKVKDVRNQDYFNPYQTHITSHYNNPKLTNPIEPLS